MQRGLSNLCTLSARHLYFKLEGPKSFFLTAVCCCDLFSISQTHICTGTSLSAGLIPSVCASYWRINSQDCLTWLEWRRRFMSVSVTCDVVEAKPSKSHCTCCCIKITEVAWVDILKWIKRLSLKTQWLWCHFIIFNEASLIVRHSSLSTCDHDATLPLWKRLNKAVCANEHNFH